MLNSTYPMRYFYSLLFTVLLFGTACQKQKFEPVPPGSMDFVLTANSVSDDYLIRVFLPESYGTSQRHYPLLIQLDGETTTGSVLKSYRELQAEGSIREIIIATVDYTDLNERIRDFSPTAHETFESSGGSADFLAFLQSELLPHLDSLFRTDTVFGPTLRGHSLGGLFGSIVLFDQDQELPHFNHFIIESPSWWWDDNFIFGLEDEFANQNQLEGSAYFAVGELELATMKGAFEAMETKLQERNYPNFSFEFEQLSKQDHLDVRENDRGLQMIFAR